jgi:hypothetical protein
VRRRKKPPVQKLFDATPFLSSLRGVVDPVPLLDAEFARAQKDLLASFEADMGLLDRFRFRIELWRLSRKFKKLKREAANTARFGGTL